MAASSECCLLVQARGSPSISTCSHPRRRFPNSRTSAVNLISRVSPTFCAFASPQQHAHDMNLPSNCCYKDSLLDPATVSVRRPGRAAENNLEQLQLPSAPLPRHLGVTECGAERVCSPSTQTMQRQAPEAVVMKISQQNTTER